MHGHHPTIDHRNRAAAGHLGSALHLPASAITGLTSGAGYTCRLRAIACVSRASAPSVFRMLKENAERETQYQQMINHLSTNVVEGIADISEKLDDMARRLDKQSA